jgi:virginiamycin B lyase
MAERLAARSLTEYVLPVATETHELAHMPGTNLLLVTQMSDSRLVKIELDQGSEKPRALNSLLMGNDSGSGLYGVWPSARFTGLVWLTLQIENRLLLVDPGQDLETPALQPR